MLTCFFENKGKAMLRHVTVNAIVMKNNKILLGKRGRYKGKPISQFGKWGLLGGFMARDENISQAVKREVMEESGWEIGEMFLLRINDNPVRPKEDRQNVDMIFIAKAIKQTKSSDEEVTHLQWFDLDKLPPKKDIAFDYEDSINLYKQYLVKKFKLPVLG